MPISSPSRPRLPLLTLLRTAAGGCRFRSSWRAFSVIPLQAPLHPVRRCQKCRASLPTATLVSFAGPTPCRPSSAPRNARFHEEPAENRGSSARLSHPARHPRGRRGPPLTLRGTASCMPTSRGASVANVCTRSGRSSWPRTLA
jgi:hypothetical protein